MQGNTLVEMERGHVICVCGVRGFVDVKAGVPHPSRNLLWTRLTLVVMDGAACGSHTGALEGARQRWA